MSPSTGAERHERCRDAKKENVVGRLLVLVRGKVRA
jgi:hypothetical protein